LFKLKQSGVFIFDSACIAHTNNNSNNTDKYTSKYRPDSGTPNGRDQDMKNSTLLPEEIQYFLINADTVFVQSVDKRSLRRVGSHFQGHKVVLSGGYLSCDVLSCVVEVSGRIFNAQQSVMTNTANNVNINTQQQQQQLLLTLHVNSVVMRLATRVQLCRLLAPPPPLIVTTSNINADSTTTTTAADPARTLVLQVQELSLDCESFGLLAIGSLLVAMEVIL
jgi:hypothetical protein